MRTETRPHEAGFGSNRASEGRGEYVPAPCTHRPSKHPSGVRMRPRFRGRIWAPQGGLSRNKVAVGESAAGSPPQTGTGALPQPTLAVFRTFDRAVWPIGHLRTTKANATSLSILLDGRGPIAQWESASFARRMPRVRIPVGPCFVLDRRNRALKWETELRLSTTEPMHQPA